MTFSVISTSENTHKIVGTVWAEAEPQARQIVSDLFSERYGDGLTVKKSEERELPLKLMN